MNIELYNLLTD